MRRARSIRPVVLAVLLACFVGTGCSGERTAGGGFGTQAAVFLGIEEPAPRPTCTTHVIVDRSAQSTATIDAVATTVRIAVDDTATRPVPSCVNVWVTGADVAAARLISHACVSAAPQGRKPQLAAAETYRRRANDELLKAAQEAFAEPPSRRSPIAETLTRIGLTPSPTDETKFYVLTDGRQETPLLGQFECRPLPTSAAWERTLHEARVLEPGSLADVDVTFLYMGFSDARRPGCETTVRREAELTALWRTALQRAGAKSVNVYPGPPPAITAGAGVAP